MRFKLEIFLNGAVDMAGQDRGNMRCFEAMGCGSLLLSDEGNYPASMVAGDNLVTYSAPNIALGNSAKVRLICVDRTRRLL